MNKNNSKIKFSNKTILQIVGVLLIFVFAGLLLWHGNATSNQAQMALTAQVYFDGEYRIENGPWHKIVEGEHISSTKGDVTLRGNFYLLTPDGEYVGAYDGTMVDMPAIALYANHINLAFYEGENEPYIIDIENALFGDSACGVEWATFKPIGNGEEEIEIVIHNPHKFGNENAIDELLSSTALRTDIEFEKGVLKQGETQRNMGLLFIIVSLLFFGIALFSTLIHTNKSKILWILGMVVFFAGTYITYSADGVSVWSKSFVLNTNVLGCSMMLYMLFLLIAIVEFLKSTKTLGVITVTSLGVINVVTFVLPVVSNIYFYDMWLYWALAQMVANIILFICLIKEILTSKDKKSWLYVGLTLPLIAFGVDVAMTIIGLWQGGISSKHVFVVFFIAAMFMVFKIVPQGINALAKSKELETEKIVLNAQLTESRMSTMISQIRPHFIYNTLGSIEQLCVIDPKKAGELVHNFAKYLRGNFGELDNPKPILMSQEMEHVHYYVSIEKVRFPDMKFVFEMNSVDFHIPALTIQPIVENAIKHGLMKLQKGGTVKVVSYETETHYCVLVEDDGAGFDTSVLLDEREHVGIRNIRARLQAKVNGTLEIESTVGVGTKVLITIPKEEGK